MNKTKVQPLLEHILNWQTVVWCMFGFSVSFLFLFICPVFLNSVHVMQFFKYVPSINPIGVDLSQILSYSESWFFKGQSPYIGNNLYPPLASLLFTPLLLVDFSIAYRIITILTLLCYGFITLILPVFINKDKSFSPLLMLFFITGLFSYGFQFEIERGQFNIIAFSLCFIAIYLYHYYYKYRYLAYLLFSISLQLKVFPGIFVIMFIKDWRDWRGNIKRIFAILAFNFSCFFVLGIQTFLDFVEAIKKQTLKPYIWIGNHSIKSFVMFYSKIKNPHIYKWIWIDKYKGLSQLILLASVLLCLCLIIVKMYKRRTTGLNPYLLVACTICAMLIPSVSHDYKLSILTAPVVIALSLDLANSNTRKRLLSILLIIAISVAYSSTLFSYTNKPFVIANNLPALIIMLFAFALLSLLCTPDSRMELPSNHTKYRPTRGLT